MTECVKNFGENVVFRPRRTYAPAHEEEVLAILDRHEGEQIRVRGSLHAWSEAAATDGVLIDLRSFDRVQIGADASGEPWAEVGGGCVLERLLSELERHGLTLPTIGAVTRQTIAGAIATATHGSGDSSLSHYVAAVGSRPTTARTDARASTKSREARLCWRRVVGSGAWASPCRSSSGFGGSTG